MNQMFNKMKKDLNKNVKNLNEIDVNGKKLFINQHLTIKLILHRKFSKFYFFFTKIFVF
jgi:hypothetical protein